LLGLCCLRYWRRSPSWLYLHCRHQLSDRGPRATSLGGIGDELLPASHGWRLWCSLRRYYGYSDDRGTPASPGFGWGVLIAGAFLGTEVARLLGAGSAVVFVLIVLLTASASWLAFRLVRSYSESER